MDTQNRKPMRLFTWITVILSLVFLVGFTSIGIYIWMLGDNGEISELFDLAVVFIGVAGIFCFVVTWKTYAFCRLQIPVWRWMIGGFKGTADTPLARSVITREQIAEAKKKMSRLQRIFMWVGNVFTALGVICLLIAVPWRLVLSVTGERTIGSTANMLLYVGILILFLGMCIFRINISCVKHRNLHKHYDNK